MGSKQRSSLASRATSLAPSRATSDHLTPDLVRRAATRAQRDRSQHCGQRSQRSYPCAELGGDAADLGDRDVREHAWAPFLDFVHECFAPCEDADGLSCCAASAGVQACEVEGYLDHGELSYAPYTYKEGTPHHDCAPYTSGVDSRSVSGSSCASMSSTYTTGGTARAGYAAFTLEGNVA